MICILIYTIVTHLSVIVIPKMSFLRKAEV